MMGTLEYHRPMGLCARCGDAGDAGQTITDKSTDVQWVKGQANQMRTSTAAKHWE